VWLAEIKYKLKLQLHFSLVAVLSRCREVAQIVPVGVLVHHLHFHLEVKLRREIENIGWKHETDVLGNRKKK